MLIGAAYATTLVLFVHANKLTTAASTIFLQATAPLYVIVLAPILLREPLRRTEVALAPLFGVGMILLFVDAIPVSATAPNPVLGNLLALGSGCTYALVQIGLRSTAREATNAGAESNDGANDAGLAAVLCGNVLAVLFCLPWLRVPQLDALGRWDVGVLIYLGVFQIGLAYFLMTRALRSLRAIEGSLLLLIELLLSPVWAWLVHGEAPGPWSWLGGAVVVFATALKVR